MPDSPRDQITLEALLRLKRAERPSADFWETFNSELQQRKLSALVKRKPFRTRLLNPVTSWVYIALPMAATILLGIVLAAPHPATSPVPGAEPVSPVSRGGAVDTAAVAAAGSDEAPLSHVSADVGSIVETRFVLDALGPAREGDARFRKVMASPTFTASIQGSTLYVADPISSTQQTQPLSAGLAFDYF